MAKVHRPRMRNVPNVVPADILPEEVRALRVDLARTLKAAMPSFREYVIHGNHAKKWNMTRLKAFQIVLTRVIPEVSENHHLHRIDEKPIHEMDWDEMRAVANSGIRKRRLEPAGWSDGPKPGEVIDVDLAAATLVEEPKNPDDMDEAEIERLIEEQEAARKSEIDREIELSLQDEEAKP